MDPFSAIIAALPMLAGLFGGGGNNSNPFGSLFNDPGVAMSLKSAMFGNGTSTLPFVDPHTGQVTYNGPNTPGLIDLQLGEALRNDPLKAAITRLAGRLLPTSAGFNSGSLGSGGAFPLTPHGVTGTDPTDPPFSVDNPARQGGGGTAGSSGEPGASTGAGASPRNRQLSIGTGATPDFSQLLAQLRTMGAPSLPPITGRLAPPPLGI